MTGGVDTRRDCVFTTSRLVVAARALVSSSCINSTIERMTETAAITSRLPKWMLPTIDEAWIKKRLTRTLEELAEEAASDPNYEIKTELANVKRELAAMAASQQQILEMLQSALAE